jgi:hypothetical protein
MNKHSLSALGLSRSLGLSGLAQANSDHLTEARHLAKQFGGQLQPTLGQAMKNGGPVNAIGVCQTKAPQIANELAQTSGWEINRVSLKNRAEKGQADDWETAVLTRFDQQRAQGADPATLEFAEIVTENGQSAYRYMKAIAIGEGQPCLHCHGTSINEPVKQKLAQLYPNDQATGYQVGQIRGAFSFKKPL